MGNPIFESFCVSSDSPSSSLYVVKTRPLQQRQGCFSYLIDSQAELCFPTFFFFIGSVLNKVEIDQATLILITPMWHTHSSYPQLLQISVKDPLFLPNILNLLISPNQENHVLVEKGSLKLLPGTVFGKSYLQKD